MQAAGSGGIKAQISLCLGDLHMYMHRINTYTYIRIFTDLINQSQRATIILTVFTHLYSVVANHSSCSLQGAPQQTDLHVYFFFVLFLTHRLYYMEKHWHFSRIVAVLKDAH